VHDALESEKLEKMKDVYVTTHETPVPKYHTTSKNDDA
jgi:hypothetical protein